MKDRYGFWFWLKWITWFVGSFVVSSAAWTVLMRAIFHEITGPELEITWCVSVFGSWFLLIIPFMRKKEQIWKRLNEDQERSVNAWSLGMGTFIGLLIAVCFSWSLLLRDAVQIPGLDARWVKNVFSTWLLLLIPLFFYMYRQADRIFLKAHERQTYTPRYKNFYVEPAKRLLPKAIIEKLKKIPETLPQAHVVHALLKNGQTMPNVFIKFRREIAGIYDQETLSFEASEIIDIEPVDSAKLAGFEETRWLRVDVHPN